MEEDYLPRTPIEMRTPITEAGLVISELVSIWEMWSFDDKLDFWDFIFRTMWKDDATSGEAQLKELKKTEDLTDWDGEPFIPGFKAAIVQISTMQVACAFAVQALKAEKGSAVAWSYACEANQWLGILQGIISGREMENGSSKLAKLGADARHTENRKMKSDVFAWCDENMARHKSMDSAAEAIAGKEVPVTFRTARSWIGEWKKLRSAGKP
ncbi:hypothetical protein ACFQUU_16405 [Herbaspirillum sp. GCM10030257]|uniref:hypothetical protein n=1 Tax=Herbaspirillum sp. GCM10030257 TaxID=3273393 RepID=UPI003609787C